MWAADEAGLRHATLEVIHGGSGELPHLGPAVWGEPPPPPAGAVLDDAVSLAMTRRPDIEVRGETRDRPTAQALVAASETTDLLVVGARGGGGFSGLLLGSVSQKCIGHARCPVVVVRSATTVDRGEAADRKIVVGIDGSAGSDRALRWAFEEAGLRSASVEAICAWQYPPVGGFVLGPPEGFAGLARRIVTAAASEAQKWRRPDVPFEVGARVGPTVPTLLEAAGDAELLVVGARGHAGVSDILVGSVAQQCAHHGVSPVVVVRPSTGRPEPVAPA